MVQNVLSGGPHAGYGFGFGRMPRGGDSSTRLSAASATRDVTGSLSVVTKEGDTVTLSASFDASVSYAGIRGGRGGANVASAQTSSSLSLQVQGNLNAQEMSDIQQVVKRFMQDLRSMVRGGQPSISNVTNVDATTLQSISASTNTQQTATAISATARPLPAPAPAVRVDGDGDQGSDAQQAALTAEDSDLTPNTSAPLPARGFVSPMPVTPSILLGNGTATRV